MTSSWFLQRFRDFFTCVPSSTGFLHAFCIHCDEGSRYRNVSICSSRLPSTLIQQDTSTYTIHFHHLCLVDINLYSLHHFRIIRSSRSTRSSVTEPSTKRCRRKI